MDRYLRDYRDWTGKVMAPNLLTVYSARSGGLQSILSI